MKMNVSKYTGLFLLCSLCYAGCYTPTSKLSDELELIFADSFENGLDTSLWVVEMASAPNSRVYVADGKLWLDTYGGVTVWLKRALQGNVVIEYDRTVVVDSGTNDRLSDLNQFWMATDPRSDHLFSRSGVFESYDSLSLYYVGVGGNYNSTTRFRKYEGDGSKPLLYEHPLRLKANHTYRVRTEVRDSVTTFSLDGEILFSHRDPAPLTEGYFGFRSTYSRQSIDQIRIYRLRD